jgi:hypothetical protein
MYLCVAAKKERSDLAYFFPRAALGDELATAFDHIVVIDSIEQSLSHE